MGYIVENPIWLEEIYLLETTDPVLGGVGGISNRQAEELTDRTAKIKEVLEENSIYIESTNHEYAGQNIIKDVVFEGTVVDGDLVYYNIGSSNFQKAIADGSVASNVIGVADVTNLRVIASGLIQTALSYSLGDIVYLSSSSAGVITDSFSSVGVGKYLYDGIIFLSSSNIGAIQKDERGVFGGGCSDNFANNYNVIEYIIISTIGDATDFGDLSVEKYAPGANSNGSKERGIFGGGTDDSVVFNVIEYITISTSSNSDDFGDLTFERDFLAGVSNGLNNRGVFGGGERSGPFVNVIDFITISTLCDAVDFGDMTSDRRWIASASNGTNDRGVFAGGYTSMNVIEYITISSLGDALDLGDLTVDRMGLSGTSNGENERGVFAGGNDSGELNIIDYIIISNIADAVDFGDLSFGRTDLASTSNGVNDRGVFGGGCTGDEVSEENFNTIEYITISVGDDALDFGDLSIEKNYLAATSNA